MQNARFWCVIATVWEDIVWCFFLRKYNIEISKSQKDILYSWEKYWWIYERSTLWVNQHMRSRKDDDNMTLSKYIKSKLLQHSKDKILISISSNPHVMLSNTKDSMVIFPQSILKKLTPHLYAILKNNGLTEENEYYFMLSKDKLSEILQYERKQTDNKLKPEEKRPWYRPLEEKNCIFINDMNNRLRESQKKVLDIIEIIW